MPQGPLFRCPVRPRNCVLPADRVRRPSALPHRQACTIPRFAMSTRLLLASAAAERARPTSASLLTISKYLSYLLMP